MQELIDQLKVARQTAQAAQNAKSELQGAFQKSDEYIRLGSAVKDADEVVSRLEAAIRAAAVNEYQTTGNKKPHGKVEIKLSKVFSIIDPARVLAWVKQNLADALIVDEKKVKAYVTKIGAVDGTQITEELKAFIATEL